jgi:lipopolysaccharide export system permease protein
VNKKNVPYRRETFSRKDVMIEVDGGFEMKDGSFLKGNAASKNIKELEVAIDSLGTANDSIGLDNWTTVKRTTYKATNKFNADDSTYMQKNNLYNINVDSIYNIASNHSKLVWKRAQLNKIKQLNVDYDIKRNVMRSLDKDLNKHKITWWEKFTLSLGCLVFFFIGAPLGAIVRKGGLGYPVLISVATFILYYIFNTSGSKMAREGEWQIWYGAWLSTMILAPLGAFFTYQSNKDSGIFNSDSIKAFFRMLFAIPEKRHITFKEVIIEDPDYQNDCTILEELHNEVRAYKKTNRLKKLPGIDKVFFNENDDTLETINDKLENLIEEMGNSKNKKVIINLNEFPVLSTHATISPFNRRWLNIASLVIFPIGIIIYLRALKFRRRLVKDLVKIESNTKNLINIIKREKLI